MNAHEFEDFLHKNIPLTQSMAFNVLEFSPAKVRIQAKLAPNTNHKSTAFGGSINSLMTVCGWAMTYAIIKEFDNDAHIVIHKSSIEYLSPINNDFTAECQLFDEAGKLKFMETYKKHGKARLALKVFCYDGVKLSAEYEGQYVALKSK